MGSEVKWAGGAVCRSLDDRAVLRRPAIQRRCSWANARRPANDVAKDSYCSGRVSCQNHSTPLPTGVEHAANFAGLCESHCRTPIRCFQLNDSMPRDMPGIKCAAISRLTNDQSRQAQRCNPAIRSEFVAHAMLDCFIRAAARPTQLRALPGHGDGGDPVVASVIHPDAIAFALVGGAGVVHARSR